MTYSRTDRTAPDVPVDVVEDWAEAAALALPPLIVLATLRTFLDERGLGSGPLRATPLGDGHSNITYLLERGPDRWVLRRPPRPPFPASAHNVLREFRLLDACRPAGLRTATPVAACEDAGVVGAPFYVMSYVSGEVLTTSLPPALDPPDERRRVGLELVDALAEVHGTDWRGLGLDRLASPDAYLERQLKLFRRLWEQNRTRDVPRVEELADHLLATRPPSPPTALVHGDYRLGNTIFDTTAPARLGAIFDWEMATLGDPFADVGYLTATWAVPDDCTGPLVALGAITAEPGFQSRAELVARYEERVGRTVTDLGWYQGLALWKAAVFLEGSYRRLLSGTTHDAFFETLADGVPALAERGWALAHGTEAEAA